MTDFNHPYMHLSAFLSAWFHQDFDLEGGTVHEVVAAFGATADDSEIALLNGEIERFTREHSEQLETLFSELFDLDIDPLAFTLSVEDFLAEIRNALSSDQPG